MIRSLLDLAAIRAYLHRHLLVSGPGSEKRVALTFDDGPHPAHTPQLLDGLRQRGVKATFFLVGQRAERHPDVARRIVDEGHEVGNHGLAHLPLPFLTPGALTREVEGGGIAIARATGTHPRFFRPPMGWITPRALRLVRGLGYEPVLGDVYARDVACPGTELIVRHVLARTRPGSIVILHDGASGTRADRSQSLEAAERIADALLEQGYRLVTLSGLVGEPPEGPSA
jgi:peptidoglycan-N-acetylglucosamine deacetylase